MKKETVNKIVKILKIILLIELIALFILLTWDYIGGTVWTLIQKV
jgi:hypothetical protein